MKFDLSEIGEIHCTLNFNEDWYNDYLQENGLSNSREILQDYVREECDYDIEYYDSETYHSMNEYDTMTIDEIEKNFGKALAHDVFNECMDGNEHSFEILAYQNDSIDINNPEELNAAALKVLRHGNYFKGCRGFILTNGMVVYTESEHNMCSKIPGINGTFHFLELGNIRVLDHSIDIYKKPTSQQMKVLWNVLDSYYGDVFYLDLLDKGIGRFSQQYGNCNPNKVMNDIVSFYDKGVHIKMNEGTLRRIISESIRKKRTVLKKSDIKRIVKDIVKTISEGYLYHKGYNVDIDNPEPYHSESRWAKWEHGGHDTGSFGSGMYFTSSKPFDARFSDEDKDAIRKGEGIEGRFIQLRQGEDKNEWGNRSGLYRVDTDFFSNLYRLHSEEEGDLLKNLMNTINNFFAYSRYSNDYSYVRYRQQAYLNIVSKCKMLGLNVPWTYKEMCSFAQNYANDKSVRQTPATIFMEMNGYNGVDATYAGKYDSYWEGSVIYDLNKVKGNIEPVKNPRDEFKVRNYNLYKTMLDDLLDSKTTPKYLGDADPITVLNALKRYPMVLPSNRYWGLPEEIKPKYLRILYQNIKRGFVSLNDAYSHYTTYGKEELCSNFYIQDIVKYGLTQYVNLDESIAKSVFSELTKTFKYPKETFEKFLDSYRGDMSVISDYVEEIQYMYS